MYLALSVVTLPLGHAGDSTRVRGADFEFEKAMLAFGKLRCALEVVDFPASILLSVFGLVA
eukprot:5369008-Pyramimonas_sp.AAC.1